MFRFSCSGHHAAFDGVPAFAVPPENGHFSSFDISFLLDDCLQIHYPIQRGLGLIDQYVFYTLWLSEDHAIRTSSI
jgi:hypothetical protein